MAEEMGFLQQNKGVPLTLRIGIDAREIQNQVTGIGRYLLNFLETAVLREDPYAYYLYYDAMPVSLFTHIKVQHIVLDGPSPFVWDQIKLPLALKRDRVNLFFSPYYKRPCFLSIPSMITVHDLGPITMPDEENFKGKLYQFYFKQLVRSAVKGSSKVIVVSDYSKRCLEECIKVPASKIRVIYNNIGRQFQPIDDPERFAGIKKKFHVKNKYIFYSGNFNPHKNVPALVHAYARLHAHLREQFQLVLTGDKNEYYDDLRHLVKGLRLIDRVIFTGHVDDADLVLLYNAADLFVFPSLYEGFGLPPLEAMACGTPVISSDATSLKEVTGNAALGVPPRDVEAMAEAIEYVLTHKEVQCEMVEKGFKRSRQFQPLQTTEKILELMDSIFRHAYAKNSLNSDSELRMPYTPKDKET